MSGFRLFEFIGFKGLGLWGFGLGVRVLRGSVTVQGFGGTATHGSKKSTCKTTRPSLGTQTA